MESKINLLLKYKGKILGRGQHEKNYHKDDFLNKYDLIYFLYDVFDHESYLTKDGFSFLKDYYGLKEIIRIIKSDGGELAQKTEEELLNWLKGNNGMPKITDVETIGLNYKKNDFLK